MALWAVAASYCLILASPAIGATPRCRIQCWGDYDVASSLSPLLESYLGAVEALELATNEVEAGFYALRIFNRRSDVLAKLVFPLIVDHLAGFCLGGCCSRAHHRGLDGNAVECDPQCILEHALRQLHLIDGRAALAAKGSAHLGPEACLVGEERLLPLDSPRALELLSKRYVLPPSPHKPSHRQQLPPSNRPRTLAALGEGAAVAIDHLGMVLEALSMIVRQMLILQAVSRQPASAYNPFGDNFARPAALSTLQGQILDTLQSATVKFEQSLAALRQHLIQGRVDLDFVHLLEASATYTITAMYHLDECVHLAVALKGYPPWSEKAHVRDSVLSMFTQKSVRLPSLLDPHLPDHFACMLGMLPELSGFLGNILPALPQELAQLDRELISGRLRERRNVRDVELVKMLASGRLPDTWSGNDETMMRVCLGSLWKQAQLMQLVLQYYELVGRRGEFAEFHKMVVEIWRAACNLAPKGSQQRLAIGAPEQPRQCCKELQEIMALATYLAKDIVFYGKTMGVIDPGHTATFKPHTKRTVEE